MIFMSIITYKVFKIIKFNNLVLLGVVIFITATVFFFLVRMITSLISDIIRFNDPDFGYPFCIYALNSNLPVGAFEIGVLLNLNNWIKHYL